MHHKKMVILSTIIPVFFSVLFLVLAISIDPLQLYHKTWFRPQTFSTNIRLQAYGIVKHSGREFDSIILGTSMLENTSSAQAGEYLGGKFINLSLSGGSEFEKFEVASFVIKNKPIKRILMSLDPYFFEGKKYTTDYPVGLYTGGLRIMTYLNDRYFLCILKNSKSEECVGGDINWDTPNYWADHKDIKDNYGKIEKWPNMHEYLYPKEENKIVNVDIKETQKSYQETYIRLVKENPNVRFDFIIPPHSILKFAVFKKNENPTLEAYRNALRYLLEELKEQKNVHFHWFYDENFVDTIKEYKDMEHYGPRINSLMLQAIAKETNILNIANFDKKYDLLENKVNNFNLKPYLKKTPLPHQP